MATIPAVSLGINPGTRAAFSHSPKSAAGHVDHVEDIAAAGQDTEPKSRLGLRNVETEAYVVEHVKAGFKLVPIVLDEVRPDEVLVEMKYSGVCHTDIVMQQGGLPFVDFPAIFGHEGAGIVRDIGRDVKIKDLQVGDAVLLSFNSCGTCKTCESGHCAWCPDSTTINVNSVRTGDRSTPARLASDGRAVRSQFFGQSSFSRMSVVNEKSVVRCPPSAVEHMGVYAPLGCGLQTGAGTVLNVVKPGKEDSIVIFGLGSVGLAALMAARSLETGQIVAVDIVPERLELARELGATHTIDSRNSLNVVKDIRDVTGGGPTFALDCTGVLRVIEDMIACVGPMGTAVQVGVPPPGVEIKLDPQEFLLANKKYIGVIEGDANPSDFIPRLIAMHQNGKFPIDRLAKFYPAAELNQAMRDMASGKVIKPVIQWS
ncbi:Putative alcohol dehydrogenase, zinc-type, GroES-like superfamily, NAD(P)-binding domain superfamily [Colletotrichum destructivum]|uniref:Alcohol dehydrogenase, zinc-type, GroES-like superfamily, NAD(P)-binding domain superfamily n=1 Tax=Colletotrichum destructivum TaxID=34406 RepID=A0AAX4IYY8_9PEZI|nr:Putative alcohol dehydrogenase, zinc-type, GroES-like superfamily, NAD(P)-binding domain superfamily [Colletotrichum destructivum]